MAGALGTNRRVDDRFLVAPMYTAITARRKGGDEAPLDGHAYDISASGMRFELDCALEPGEHVNMDISLPGADAVVAAHGKVIWVHDDVDDPGPRRMALRFDDFHSAQDRARLLSYLETTQIRQAA